MTAKNLPAPFVALLLSLLLTGCQTLLPSPDTFVAPPPENAWRLTELAPGVRLLEYQGPRTTVTANAAYVSGSGGSVGVGINLAAPARGAGDSGAGRRSLPRIQAAAILVDLAEAELLPIARVPVETEDARSGETLTLRPSATLSEREDLVAAINGSPFQPVPIRSDVPVDPVGVVIKSGNMLSEYAPGYGAIYTLGSGKTVIGEQPPELTEESTEEIREALGGFGLVLIDGEVRGRRSFRDARSGVALTEDGETAIILAVAGGAPGTSVGLTSQELGTWLKSLGGSTGLMLDGGGSTSLAVREASPASGTAGDVRLAVTPSWGPTLGVERPVATLLAVRRR